MELRNLINKIAQESDVIFRSAEPGDIETLSSLNLPPSVIDFYKRFEPQDCAEIDGVRLWPIKEMLRENTDFVPGADIHKYGYIVFATTDFGDAYCLDTDETNTNSDHQSFSCLMKSTTRNCLSVKSKMFEQKWLKALKTSYRIRYKAT